MYRLRSHGGVPSCNMLSSTTFPFFEFRSSNFKILNQRLAKIRKRILRARHADFFGPDTASRCAPKHTSGVHQSATMSSKRLRPVVTTTEGDEDEKLFGTFISENKPTKERLIVYIVNALIVSIAPVCKYIVFSWEMQL